jgi:hypothetical protein
LIRPKTEGYSLAGFASAPPVEWLDLDEQVEERGQVKMLDSFLGRVNVPSIGPIKMPKLPVKAKKLNARA